MKVKHPDGVLPGTPRHSQPRVPLNEDLAEPGLQEREQQEVPLHTQHEEESRPPWTPDPGE